MFLGVLTLTCTTQKSPGHQAPGISKFVLTLLLCHKKTQGDRALGNLSVTVNCVRFDSKPQHREIIT